jgi:hypothetical protein
MPSCGQITNRRGRYRGSCLRLCERGDIWSGRMCTVGFEYVPDSNLATAPR